MKSCLIRADASPRRGTGHVMRGLALALAWQSSNGKVAFLHAETTAALKRRLQDEKMELMQGSFIPGSTDDAIQTIAEARAREAAWVVADGYEFDAGWQQQISDAGLKLLLLDDYGHAREYHADYIVNQNPSIDSSLYQNRKAGSQLLLGPEFAILRPEFLDWRDWQRQIPAAGRNVLVTLGGADPDNVTAKVIRALKDLEVQSKIVVGGSNPHLTKLESELETLNSEMELIVDAPSMPELMAWADCAIAAGGTTSLELACMGLPSLVLVLADNQRNIAAKLHEIGIGRNLGWHASVPADAISMELCELLLDQKAREIMCKRGQLLVDGLGARRIVKIMEQSVPGKAKFAAVVAVHPD